MASNFKLSVVLEAITAAFNTSVKEAASTFTKAEADMATAAQSSARTVDTSAQEQADALDAVSKQVVLASRNVATAVQSSLGSPLGATATVAAYEQLEAAVTKISKALSDGTIPSRGFAASLTTLQSAARAGIISNDQLAAAQTKLFTAFGQVSAVAAQANAAVRSEAQAAADAAALTQAANDKVKPPSPATFQSFFNELVTGWKIGGQAGTDAAAVIAAATAQAGANIRALGVAIGTVSPTAKQVGADIANSLNLKTISTAQLQKVKDAINELSPQSKKVETDVELALALRQLNSTQLSNLKNKINELPPAAKDAGKQVEDGLSLGGLVKGIAVIATVKRAIKELVDSAINLQELNNQLLYTEGGAAQAASSLALIRSTANSLGLSLDATSHGFVQLSAATKGTQLEGKATEDLFIGVSQAAATMGLSTAKTNSVFLALAQIAGKGTVQMQELKQQLGQDLPGALAIAAKALGVTVPELTAMAEAGLDSVTFLKAFGPALQGAFSASATRNLQTLGGQLTLLKNNFDLFLVDLNASGAAFGLTQIVKDLSAGLAQIDQLFKTQSTSPEVEAFKASLSTGYDNVKEAIKSVIEVVGTLYDTLNTIFGQLQELGAILTRSDLDGHQLSLLQGVMLGLNLSVAAVADTFRVMSVLITDISGVASVFVGGLAKSASGLIGLFGAVTGVGKQLASDLARFSDEQFAAADKSFAKGQQQAKDFRSSILTTLDAAGTAADAAQTATDKANAGIKATNDSLATFAAVAKGGLTSGKDLQAQSDAIAASYQKLFNTGQISEDQLKTKLAELVALLPKLAPPIDDALTEFKKLGVDGLANLNGVTEGTAKAIIQVVALADSSKTSSQVIRTDLSNLIDTAKTQADFAKVADVIAAFAARNKLSAADSAENFLELTDKIRLTGETIPKSLADSFARAGTATADSFKRAADQAVVDLARIKAAYDANPIGVGIAAVVDAEIKVANAHAAAFQGVLGRIGTSTKEQIAEIVKTAQTDLDKARELYGQGQIAYQGVINAQINLTNAQAQAVPGAVTLADVTKRLADQNKEYEDKLKDAAKAQDDYNKKAKEAKPALADVTSAGAGLTEMFGTLRDQLLGLSAEAANDFGQKLGVQFGYIDAGATDATATVSALREEISKLTQFGGTDFIGISSKMKDITIAADATKIAFAEQKAQVDANAAAIQALADNGTVSLAQLQTATKLSGQSFGVLGKADLTGLNSALDAAKARITAIEDASKSAAESLKAMGDSLQVEILRAAGKNVEAIQLEAAQQAATIDKQITDLGKNASPDALAQAQRAKDLLAQNTAQKVAAQKASDAADAASAAKATTDTTPNIAVPTTPAQATAPAPVTPSAPTSGTAAASKTVVIQFKDAAGKSTSVTASSSQTADDLLAILARSGATNISKQGG